MLILAHGIAMGASLREWQKIDAVTSALLRWSIEIAKRTMRFPYQCGQGGAVTAEIMRTFGDGCASALRGDPAPKFESAMQSLAWHQRSYFCEGHAMGLAA